VTDATAWSVSPDGSQIAFTAVPGLVGSREIWLMTKEGEQARKLFATNDENSGFARVAWSPDGKRVGYLKFHQVNDRFEKSIETMDPTRGQPTVLLTSSSPLHDFYWLPDGRVAYSLGDGKATVSDNCNLWEVQVNAVTGAPVEQPRRLTNWAGSNVDHLSATSHGKRLVFQKSSVHVNVLIGELKDENTKLSPPQKLTLTEAYNMPTAWTSDSKAVIFSSDRNGHWGIYKQELNRDSAETLVISDVPLGGRTVRMANGCFTPLIRTRTPIPRTPSTMSDLRCGSCAFPSPVARRNWFLTARLLESGPWCARSPSTLCAFAEQTT
jgi:Tol biopolymer transport system component